MHFAVSLHDVEQVKFLGQELVTLEVVHHLDVSGVLGLTLRVSLIEVGLFLFSFIVRVDMPKSGELDALARWQPFEVEHGVNGLNLDPVVSELESVSDQA